MSPQDPNFFISRLQEADRLHKRVLALSEKFFVNDTIGDMAEFLREAEFLLKGVKGTDAVIGIFNHTTYSTELEVGHQEFWGLEPGTDKTDRMKSILSLAEKGYESFFSESVAWFTKILQEIPFEQRVNFKFHHCGIRYRRLDGKPICLFSQGIPIQYNAERHFNFTLNYVENVSHLLKKDFPHYWIRMEHGVNREFVHSLHSDNKEYANRDLLSAREKEILQLIAADLDTKEIADQLFISPNTVGNHRSKMIERLGARDTTALVQLAKMACMIQ